MSSRFREKLALFVFLGLILLSLFGLGWYVIAGHSWNVAASNIDDTFGSMEGYTAIVYPGTAEPVARASEKLDAKAESSGGVDKEESSLSGLAGFMGLDKKSNTADQDTQSDPPLSDEGYEAQDIPTSPDDDITAGSLTKKPVVSVQEVVKSYEEKNSTVFSLDTDNLELYSEGVILRKGSHRFGVFSVTEPLSRIVLEKQIAYFNKHEVDFVVVLTSDILNLDYAVGVDIVVSTQDEGLFVMGETIDATFYVDSPTPNRVGAILISPSNVVSAKVIEEL